MTDRLKDLIRKTDFDKLFQKLHYTYYKEQYKLNIIGIRDMSSLKQDDTFNDALVITYKEDNHFIRRVFDVTTDPGKFYLKNPLNNKGCAIVVPNQYTDTYSISKHNNKYYALCQRLKPIQVYRDSNKNDILDTDSKSIETGMFGCNIHKSFNSSHIGKNSAGCTVFKND